MSTFLVLTVSGPDQPGLVETLSQAVADHQGSWLESRMARLSGHFAGVLRVSVPEEQVGALTQALESLEPEGLRVSVARSELEPPTSDVRKLRLEIRIAAVIDPGHQRMYARILQDRRAVLAG